AAVIATFVQAVLYGIYISTLAFCLRWLLYADEGWGRRKKTNCCILTITILVAVFSTTNLGISLQLTIVYVMDGNTKATDVLSAINTAFELATMMIADAVLIYHCWMVYGKSKIVIALPLILWLANIACSILIIVLYAVLIPQPTVTEAWLPWFGRLWLMFFPCNITINVYATVAIIYRILCVVQGTSSSRSRFYKTGRILAESGILYTVSTALNLVATVIDNGPQDDIYKFVFDVINFSMAGIAFNLILIRVGQGRVASDDSTDRSADTRAEMKPPSTLQFDVPKTIVQDQSFDLSHTERGGRWTGDDETSAIVDLRAEEIMENSPSIAA
ncbi:hypothetical protein M378DRAFT_83586, partial [Amanita muscaria Koide BX008]